NNFYRLKIVDNDATVEYSNVVLLRNTAGIQLSVFPNPAAQLLYVRIPALNNTLVIAASVLDANGKIVLQPLLKTGADNKIEVGKLAAGLYTLQCIINDKPFVLRFIKNQ
ncbi:MAG: T9SS type A sorting domain-containing protein, partial [Sphingobacteriales bacterium]